MNETIRSKFLTNTDDTGRFIVFSERTGRTYFVEPIMYEHGAAWGSIDPATKKLVNKPGAGKYRGAINPEESLITVENGFKNITELDKGTSPLHAIEVLDAKYPDRA